jgi:hypothetical protein
MPNEWDFIANEPVADRTEAIAAYKKAFENIHASANWADLTDGLDIKIFGYDKKPKFEDFWKLNEVGVSPFASQRANSDLADVESLLTSVIKQAAKIKNDYERFMNDTSSYDALQILTFTKVNQAADKILTYFKAVRDGTAPTSSQDEIFAELERISQQLATGSTEVLALFRDGQNFINKHKFSLTPTEEQFKIEYLKAVKSLGTIKELTDLTDTERRGVIIGGGAAADAAKKALTSSTGDLAAAAAAAKADAEKSARQAVIATAQNLSENVTFFEQCFVTSILKELIDKRFDKSNENAYPVKLPYVQDSSKNKPIYSKGDGFGYINALAVSKTQSALFKINEKELSTIVPGMQLYKVIPNVDGKDKQIEIAFDTNVKKDLNSYISRGKTNQGGRGLGVGVKSFNFSYDGVDPFSAKKAITANLVLYATSFSDLLREREDSNGNKFRYVDLALKTGTINSKKSLLNQEQENADRLNFRIKVVTGWGANNQNIRSLSKFTKDALYDSSISMFLDAVTHEFDFDDAGGCTFRISYQAYIEDYFSTREFDIFGSMGIEKQIRKLFLAYFKDLGCTVQSNPEYKAFTDADQKYIIETNSEAVKSIHNKLVQSGKMYQVKIAAQQMVDWYKDPIAFNLYGSTASVTSTSTGSAAPPAASTPPAPGPATGSAAAAAGTAGDSKEQKGDAASTTPPPVGDGSTSFAIYYLGDIIEVIMDNISESLRASDFSSSKYVKFITEYDSKNQLADVISSVEKQFEKSSNIIQNRKLQFENFRLLLGPINLLLAAAPEQPINCSLGDIPVSHSFFMSFLDSKINSRNLSNYPFSRFVKELIKDLLGSFLNSRKCPSSQKYKKVKLNSTVISAYDVLSPPSGSKDDLTSHIIKNGMEHNYFDQAKVTDKYPILAVAGPKGDPNSQLNISKMKNYYVFFAGSQHPAGEFTGNRAVDETRGVFHYTLGENRGIVKSITLQKTDAPYLKEARFELEGYDGLTQLREVYNVNIQTFFNPQAIPGSYIFVEPKGFDPTVEIDEDLTKYGIGGYLMVIKANNSIKPGDGSTEIIAQWVASADGQYVRTKRLPQRKDQGEEAPSKCTVFTSSGTKPSNTTAAPAAAPAASTAGAPTSTTAASTASPSPPAPPAGTP